MISAQRGFRLAAGLLIVAAVMLGLAAFAAELQMAADMRRGLAIGGAVLGLIAGPLALSLALRHLGGLHLVETALHGIATQPGRVLAADAPSQLDTGMRQLWRQIASLSQRGSPEIQLTRRLASILAALPQPVVVVTEQGLVTLANRLALEFFGGDHLRPGTSVFEVIDRDSFARQTMHAAQDAIAVELTLTDGSNCTARCRALPDRGGIVIAIDATSTGQAGLVHALDLHEAAPPRVAPTPTTPLESLTVMVLDCETTGLNAAYDRLLSLAAVRVQGTGLLRNETIDVLVNPGEPIPARSTAIHGITDAMVMQSRPLAEQWHEIEPMLRDCVIVGHNIGFDLTVLENELRRAGLQWQRPASLCTVQLASALDPRLSDLNLEKLAEIFGIAVTGRHTALGDALVTADVYLHLLALMTTKGDRTWSDAQARAAAARRVIRQQQAAGW